MTVGVLIKKYRKRANLTQEALAKKIGCATITIRQYESGKRSPNLNVLEAISKALNVDLFDLVPDDSEKSDPFSHLSKEEQEIVLDVSKDNEELKAILSIFFQIPDDIKLIFLKKLRSLEKEAEEERRAVDQKKDN